MAKATKDDESTELHIISVEQETLDFWIVGTSPFIYHEFSPKARHELLLPKGKKNNAEKASSLKHDPLVEYRASMLMAHDNDGGPTRLQVRSTMFKAAFTAAALDLPSVNKSMIGRLLYVTGVFVNMYGVPQLLMSMVRSADMNKTPDVRTRAILPEWCCKVSVRYAVPFLNAKSVANLAATAGMTIGVGDWRPQKGKGDYGQFRVATRNDADVLRLTKECARKAQDPAIADPIPYDVQTASDLAYFNSEVKRRGWERGADDELRPASSKGGA